MTTLTRLETRGMRGWWAGPLMLVLLVPLALAGCTQAGQGSAGSAQMTLTTTPAQPAVGPAQVTVTLKDASGNPIDNAQVAVEGDMTHAGMVPVQANAVGEGNGQYMIKDFSFTMGGDWVLTVSATLPDGTKAQQTFNINGVTGGMPMTPGASTTGTVAPRMPMTGTVAPSMPMTGTAMPGTNDTMPGTAATPTP